MKKNKNQNLKKIYFSEVDELIKITSVLLKDLERIIDQSNKKAAELEQKSESIFLDEQETWFRQANRITISTVEAICFKMKQITLLLFDHSNKTLSQKEREKLSEKKLNGTPFYLKTKDNVKFSFNMFAKVLGIPFEIKFNKDWANFLKVINKRNNLTHPKSENDLKMSAKEHRNTANAFEWFGTLINQFINNIDKYKNK
jgi:hypothetical protein